MKWEYKTVKLQVSSFSSSNFELPEMDKFINQFGQDGWELVSTLGIVSFNSFYPYTNEIILFSNAS